MPANAMLAMIKGILSKIAHLRPMAVWNLCKGNQSKMSKTTGKVIAIGLLITARKNNKITET
jgi:hypothetical protein